MDTATGAGMPGLPHVRGGVSNSAFVQTASGRSSPRAWGCFPGVVPICHLADVFPTCVGVFLPISARHTRARGLPHVRGGVSFSGEGVMAGCPSSPRAWGCFSAITARKASFIVFPTCVGVFLAEEVSNALHARLPHVRGGVSRFFLLGWVLAESSPRAWGCFPPEGTSHEPV